MTYRYLIGLGSNDRAEERLSGMVEALLLEFGALCLSPVCRTSAVGESPHGEGEEYLNAVASLESTLFPVEFRAICKNIETQLGRIRPSSLCAADIDILACWEKIPVTQARDFIQEPYYQPLADSVLECLGLYCGDDSFSHPEAVDLKLQDGRNIGLETLSLQSASLKSVSLRH